MTSGTLVPAAAASSRRPLVEVGGVRGTTPTPAFYPCLRFLEAGKVNVPQMSSSLQGRVQKKFRKILSFQYLGI